MIANKVNLDRRKTFFLFQHSIVNPPSSLVVTLFFDELEIMLFSPVSV